MLRQTARSCIALSWQLPFHFNCQMSRILPTWDLVSLWEITTSRKPWAQYTIKWDQQKGLMDTISHHWDNHWVSSISSHVLTTELSALSFSFNLPKRLQEDNPPSCRWEILSPLSHVMTCAQYGGKGKDAKRVDFLKCTMVKTTFY